MSSLYMDSEIYDINENPIRVGDTVRLTESFGAIGGKMAFARVVHFHKGGSDPMNYFYVIYKGREKILHEDNIREYKIIKTNARRK